MARRRMHKRPGEKPYEPPPPKHEVVDGPYEAVTISYDEYKDFELNYWLNQKLLDGLELVTAISVVGVRNQYACTTGIKYIFRRAVKDLRVLVQETDRKKEIIQ